MINTSPEVRRYREGLEELLWLVPHLGRLARAMGEPLFDESQPTAYVTFDELEDQVVGQSPIRFCFNPEFLMTLEPVTVAAVLAHECHHVFLDHLKEGLDRTSFPRQDLLIKAQEVIINDTVEGIHGLLLPDFVMRGPAIVGCDCSPYNSRQVYTMLLKEEPEQNEQKSDSGENPSNSSAQASSGSGAGQPQARESQPNRAPEDDGSKPENSSEKNQPQEGSGGDSKDSPNAADTAKEASPNSDKKDEDISNGESEDRSSDDHSNYGYGCGGVQVPEARQAYFSQAVENVISNVAQETGRTPEEVLQDLTRSGGGFSMTSATGEIPAEDLSPERMNWKNLLAIINPKVMDSGRRRRKSINNWTRTNRRMTAVYPEVILPTVEHIKPKKDDDDGDTIPTFIIALDLSGSIPHQLVKTLQSMLEDIPHDLIRPFPCTWGSNLVVWDEKRQVCSGYGTRIHLVSKYVEQVTRETKSEPYVLVITDGRFPTGFSRPGKDWFFMAVNDSSMSDCKSHAKHDSHTFNIKDFKAR